VDFECEYPPVALLIFLIPGLIFRTLPPYYIAFTVEMLLFDILAIYLIIYISRRINISKVNALAIYTLLIAITAGPIATQRYDMAPAVMVLASVAAFVGGKNRQPGCACTRRNGKDLSDCGSPHSLQSVCC
jgi:hypothetical protein